MKKLTSEQIQEIASLHESGLTPKEISSKTSINIYTVRYNLVKQNLLIVKERSSEEKDLLQKIEEAKEKMKEALKIKRLKEQLVETYKEIEKMNKS